ncbi:hypothetical protein HYPSUDRAFT_200177 [Hypholoma sublateritium FD-334 SS-4]|uniref:Uncharacterized protein n=1 Tax=Hypholoma sublateritium (strain FD-334 SS-4) TaxID=945553 RepID=A0A0D2P1U7_HYPSF|nr:hypothetical protein HYPSUDRAFT_200177 [Hypholoma sublateritium FD-334 SS-4]
MMMMRRALDQAPDSDMRPRTAGGGGAERWRGLGVGPRRRGLLPASTARSEAALAVLAACFLEPRALFPCARIARAPPTTSPSCITFALLLDGAARRLPPDAARLRFRAPTQRRRRNGVPQRPSRWIRPWGFPLGPIAADVSGGLPRSLLWAWGIKLSSRACVAAARQAGGPSARSVRYASERQKSRRQQRDFCSTRATGFTAPCVGPAQHRTAVVPASHARRPRVGCALPLHLCDDESKNGVLRIGYGHGDAASRTDVCSHIKIYLSVALHAFIRVHSIIGLHRPCTIANVRIVCAPTRCAQPARSPTRLALLIVHARGRVRCIHLGECIGPFVYLFDAHIGPDTAHARPWDVMGGASRRTRLEDTCFSVRRRPGDALARHSGRAGAGADGHTNGDMMYFRSALRARGPHAAHFVAAERAGTSIQSILDACLLATLGDAGSAGAEAEAMYIRPS